MVTRHEEIPNIWAEYLVLLEEAKKALELNKDKFKTELLEQAEVSYKWSHILFLSFLKPVHLLLLNFKMSASNLKKLLKNSVKTFTKIVQRLRKLPLKTLYLN